MNFFILVRSPIVINKTSVKIEREYVIGLLPYKPVEKESVLSDQDDKEIMTKVAYFVKSDNSTLKYEAEFY